MENQDKFLENDKLETTYTVEEQKIISLNKFAFLSIITFGLYEIWWIYKSWDFFSEKEKLNINPAIRTIFSIFFLVSLFNKILRFAREKGYPNNYLSFLLFVGFFVAYFMAYLPVPFGLITFIGLVFLIPPFKALNFAKRNSTDFITTEQTSFNGKQIVLIVIGAIFWFLVLLGLVVMATN